jgi:hydrogenase maturation protein HypF
MANNDAPNDAVGRARIVVEGTVQGVGFRPYVSSLAHQLDLCGFVGNDTAGVFIEVEGPQLSLDLFVQSLTREPPPLARIDQLRTTFLHPIGGDSFRIVESTTATTHDALVTPDAGTCDDCLREIRDPDDRRFGYPFTNCTNCGPRFTIILDVPYDRQNTTMADFTMCARCRAEYDDPLDRRFHAQPVCCPDCGPTLRLFDSAGDPVDGNPVAAAAARLASDGIVAIKGIGGYHLAVDACREEAVSRLRERKHREDRPFALMAADLDTARMLCTVDDAEARLLSSPERPIVLLRRRRDTAVANAVAPRTAELGVMLPYTPLHHLLLDQLNGPLVLTSGNLSDEPIAFDDDDAWQRLSPLADAVLTHDRRIETRVDDSVTRVVDGHPALLRRSRGYAPAPLRVPVELRRPVLACGAQQKSTFCLARGHHAFMSHHIGDLQSYETLTSFVEGVDQLKKLLAIRPEVVAYDLHPDYLSTAYALELPGVELVGVQHHHAHIASCLADNETSGPVIGVAFDGTGFGPDGTIWGGEFLVADLRSATRVAHLSPVPMPGGAAAIREPWRMAASYLNAGFPEGIPAALEVELRHPEDWSAVLSTLAAGINSPLTSSAGRLFDAVAALLDVRDEVTYEGQAAIELEQLSDLSEAGEPYRASITEDDLPQVRAVELVRAVVADRAAGVPTAAIAARFHHGVADLIVRTCVSIRERHGLGQVALSGGVFQNVRLLTETTGRLHASGFSVLTHHRVPPNDGGISLGQAVIAGARDLDP